MSQITHRENTSSLPPVYGDGKEADTRGI